ncbi:ATP-binding protein [Lysinibacillus sp. 54212]|uniref:ATP-binding protein n=1 Tax=Lysinibacillus sp. 54212 TaxID=3119829 RepID=UPI002FC92D7A
MERIIKISKTPSSMATILLIAILTAIGSEIKIMPFDGAPFRFGLGSIIFFLAILIRPVPIIRTGIITACIVLVFRTLLDFLLYKEEIISHAFAHLPAALFYITFASCLYFLKIDSVRMRPFILGLYGALFEIVANSVEQLATSILLTQHWDLFDEFLLFIGVAFLRSFFVVGLFSSIAVTEQKKRTEQLLNIESELYVETLYLQKSMDTIEQITANGFDLYKKLKEIDQTLAIKALMLAQEIHEIKKDTERIYAGLSKIVTTERTASFLLSDLLRFCTEANARYSEHLGKRILFETTFNEDFETKESMLILAMLNNIIANAVEAIEQDGTILLSVSLTDNTTIFTIENNGPVISQQLLPVIFDPGYTTKYNASGVASTGIGLSHVQAIITHLEGTITVKSEHTTIFTIIIPTDSFC